MKHLIGLLIALSTFMVWSCKAPKELRPEEEEFAEFIGASNPRQFYEKNGFLPYVYYNIDNSTIMRIEFIGTNLMRSSNKHVFRVSPHFTTCPYITIDSLVYMNISMDTTSITQHSTLQRLLGYDLKYIDLCAGDTIFADEKMMVLWANGNFLRGEHISSYIFKRQEGLYNRFLDDYFKHMVEYLNYQSKHPKK